MDIFKIDFIGIGAQKSATTWIYKCLIDHPQICGFEGKETHFFDIEKKYEKGLSYYNNHFSECDKEKVIGEFTPSYLCNSKVPGRIKDLCGEVKLIVCLRNPIERAFSAYLHYKSINTKKISFEDTMEENETILEKGMYGKYLTEYFKIFSKDNILILYYDDIESNPENFIKKIYKFLNVDSEYVSSILEKKLNTSKNRNSKVYKRIVKSYLKCRKKRAGRFLIKSLRKLGINNRNISGFINCLSPEKEKINKKQVKMLRDYYDVDMKILESLIKNDIVSKWRNFSV